MPEADIHGTTQNSLDHKGRCGAAPGRRRQNRLMTATPMLNAAAVVANHACFRHQPSFLASRRLRRISCANAFLRGLTSLGSRLLRSSIDQGRGPADVRAVEDGGRGNFGEGFATLTGMTVDTFNAEAKKWSEVAKDGRWKRPYTELTYQPMHEVLSYLRANGFKTYIVTGGGQDFVRVYSERVYGIPPEQVVGTAGSTKYSYDQNGKPILTKEPKLLLNDNDAGKPEGIHLMIGRRPIAAFGNSTGDEQMLEYTGTGKGLRLKMLVLHDDAEREYAYGPAQGLPDTKVGTFTQDLYDEAKKDGWVVISMKQDWKRIFGFDSAS